MLHGQTRYNVKSRFLGEIPQALKREVRPARFAAGSQMSSQRGYSPPASRGVATQSFLHTDTGTPWRIGQNVVHPKFGSGVIVSAEGRGADARVQVNFRESGLKWLMLEYARLAPS
jgi:DNA helicase-2/ATP-dependent DNA helicase PcrA